MDALQGLGLAFTCYVVECEYWHPMTTPNLLVELSGEHVGELMSALSFHAGEVQRNPYHLEMIAWMMDNVRRGAELVGGQGAAAPNYLFGGLYRVRRWSNGQLGDIYPGGKLLSLTDAPADLFPA